MAQPEIPPDWADALRLVSSTRPLRLLVLGPPDAGKSTFCRLLLQHAARQDRRPALLDTDPGQKQVGPPACVTLGHPAGPDMVLTALAFIGTLEPLHGWNRLITGATGLADRTRADLLVINTCGLLRGPGRRLKRALIAALQPDLLVAISNDPGLDAVLADHPGLPALRLLRAPQARRKTDGERRMLRQTAFRSYFAQSPVWPLPTAGLRAEPAAGDEEPQSGRLLALADAQGRDMVVAAVVQQDAPGTPLVRAPRPENVVTRLRWSSLWLDADWNALSPAAIRQRLQRNGRKGS